MKPLSTVRRVITGTNADGRSYIQYDGPATACITLLSRPGYCNANLWRTSDNPSATDSPDDIQKHKGVLPPVNGTVLRVVDFPPQPSDPDERRKQAASTFAAIYPDAQHHAASSRDPAMHTTSTVDYAIVLSGEITAVMEEGETVLRSGDVLVQRGTAHAWANHSHEIARVAFVLIDAPVAFEI